jgi:tol-pal system protein YbgF
MHIRPILAGAALVPFLLAGPVMARSLEQGYTDVSFLGVFGNNDRSQPRSHSGETQYAQTADPRVDSLEDKIRQLNGKIEELNFQVLQMQDRLNKMQNDNEFRFEQLEKNSGGGGGSSGAERTKESRPAVKGSLEAPGNRRDDTANADIKSIIQAPDNISGNASGSAPGSSGVAEAGRGQEERGAPPRSLGSITFDAEGNPVGGSINEEAIESRPELEQPGRHNPPPPPKDDTRVASLPPTDNANELYRDSYQFILSGDYKTAEEGFRQHIARFPNDPRTADAHFWLGEALLGQDKYRDAAQVFLDANRTYPKSKKAPDMLLKLGVALAAMHQRDIACATYKEIGTRYPKASEALKERAKREEALSGC